MLKERDKKNLQTQIAKFAFTANTLITTKLYFVVNALKHFTKFVMQFQKFHKVNFYAINVNKFKQME